MRTFSSFYWLLEKIRAFHRSERGMTLPMLAMSLVAITGMVGVAIDTARAQLVQSKLQFSLDAAGLAAGSTVSTSSLNTEVTKYLMANFNGYLGATLTGNSASVDSSNTIIDLAATAQLPSTFLGVVGVNTINVKAASQISRAVTGLELVLVLDNTGSMANSAGAGVSKIAALQTASTTLVNTLFGGKSTADKLWIGIVPFSQAVNIGTSHTAWLDTTFASGITSMAASQGPGWGSTSWGGCVDARDSNSEDTIDDPPSSGTPSTLFRPYYWPTDNIDYGSPYNNALGSGSNNWASKTYQRCKSGTCVTKLDSCSTSNGHTCTFTGYTYASPLDTLNQGPNLLCPQQVTTMTNSKQPLLDAISSMTAQGNTLINQGLHWGWNMISPRWRGQWGGTMDGNGLPLDYNSHGMVKAVVLLTDGVNTQDNSSHSSYWYLGNGKLGTTSSSNAITQLDSRTRSLCTAMKNKGIYVYTIALGTDTTTASLQLLKDCATATNYYFNSPSTTQLQDVFNSIGDSLSNLRVSK